jgi:hypothetical protein
LVNVVAQLVKQLRDSAAFNPEVQVAPACILWPDKDRQWEAVIPRLQGELEELLVLGDYAPERRTGPAIWLRCVIAHQVAETPVAVERVPVLYLPGVSRQELRAIETCLDALKPLAELQYRGVLWSQANAKDWTIAAFLKSTDGGLGLDVAQDNDAKSAMQLALPRLLDEDVGLLKRKRLDRDYFNTLLTGGDPVRDLLEWLDQGDDFHMVRDQGEWKAFVEVCKSQMAFNPHSDGVLAGARKLASSEGPWSGVWRRYSEAPARYAHIPERMRQCQPPAFDLFTSAETAGGWPQWNEQQEAALRGDLQSLTDLPAHTARQLLHELEKKHAPRRRLVWAELHESPLALAITHLEVLAEVTHTGLTAGSLEDLQTGYVNQGWRADDAVLSAMACVDTAADVNAVTAAVRSIYLPWLEDSARYLQNLVNGSAYPGGAIATAKPFEAQAGECVLFVDGLRFDTARRLSARLELHKYRIDETPIWTALPSVTATGKAAVSPVRNHISGPDNSDDFEPCVASTGQSLKGGYHLKKLLAEADWIVLDRNSNGDGHSNAWCEFGDIDHEGHARGWKLAKHVDSLLAEVAERITALLTAGWTRVRVVTDHGWLLLPGALPKQTLASALLETRWGRCAALKPGTSTKERLYPWYWNPNQHFVLADGVCCFKAGEEYAHGGLSLQECLTLQLTVTHDNDVPAASKFEISDIVWRGLRCKVAVDGQTAGLSLDIRTEPGNAASSVALTPKPLKDAGTSSVVVDNEELAGQPAFVVLLNQHGGLVAERNTVIGDEYVDGERG